MIVCFFDLRNAVFLPSSWELPIYLEDRTTGFHCVSKVQQIRKSCHFDLIPEQLC